MALMGFLHKGYMLRVADSTEIVLPRKRRALVILINAPKHGHGH